MVFAKTAFITKRAKEKLDIYKETYKEYNNSIVGILIDKYVTGKTKINKYIDHSTEEFEVILFLYPNEELATSFPTLCIEQGRKLDSVISCLIEQEL
jgi:hypothetical protein